MQCLFVALASAVVAPSALAGFTTTDPGRLINIDTGFESRIRLDGGSSQTWKTAFWSGDDVLLSESGVNRDVFADGVAFDFEISYDFAAGDASITVFGVTLGNPGNPTVADLTLTDTIALSPGFEPAGFRYFVTSNDDGSTTEAFDLMASVDGGTPQPVADILSGPSNRFIENPPYFFDAPVTTFALSGKLRFDWVPGSNLMNERFKLTVKLLEGEIPSPGVGALLGLAGLAAVRRRR